MQETYSAERPSRTVHFPETGETFLIREQRAPELFDFAADLRSIGAIPQDSGVDPSDDVDAATVSEAEFDEARRAVINKWGPRILSNRTSQPYSGNDADGVLSQGLTDGEFDVVMMNQLIANSHFRRLGERRRFASTRTAIETPTTPSRVATGS